MNLLILNALFVIILLVINRVIKRIFARGFFYDVGFQGFYIYVFSPFVLALANILYYFFQKEGFSLFLAVSAVSVIVIAFVCEKKRDKASIKRYRNIESRLTPLIEQVFQELNVQHEIKRTTFVTTVQKCGGLQLLITIKKATTEEADNLLKEHLQELLLEEFSEYKIKIVFDYPFIPKH
ncbi:hypothetical protein [Bacillus sp. JJ783]|uniref:hypothetical protein n=1 Tax=Bacillus sp. JJ783 TaxID=3122974 RepID=UPI003001D826